jgi:hypothetical protein
MGILMKARKTLPLIAASITGVVIGFLLANELAFDGCLDRGGVWNSQYRMCDADLDGRGNG